jgi:hypothetical protein
MTAYPAKIEDLERVLQQMSPDGAGPIGGQCSGLTAPTRPAEQTWRLVSADGLAKECGAADSDPVDCPEPFEETRDLGSPPPASSDAMGLASRPNLSKLPIPLQVASGRPWDVDAHLARLIDAWPRLPETIHVAILAMVEAVQKEQRELS